MSRRSRGLSLVELIIAFILFLIAVPTIYSTMTTNYRHSVVSRNRVAANFISRSFFEEVSGHPFGQPAPKSWPVPVVGGTFPSTPAGWENLGWPAVQDIVVFVEDRQQKMTFLRQVQLKNGSLIGKSTENFDQLTIKVTWVETGDTREKSATGKITVWRQDAP